MRDARLLFPRFDCLGTNQTPGERRILRNALLERERRHIQPLQTRHAIVGEADRQSAEQNHEYRDKRNDRAHQHESTACE
jgi:hypothetical protein